MPGELLMFRVAEKVVLSLWDATAFEAETGAAPARGSYWGWWGYFADPDGSRWEFARNPGPIGQDVLP